MDDFKGFKLQNTEALKNEKKEEESFVSNYGTFPWYDDRMIYFARKPQMFMLWLLTIFTLVISIIGLVQLFSLNIDFLSNQSLTGYVINGLAVLLSITIAVLPVIGLTFIIIGGWRISTLNIRTGINIMKMLFSMWLVVLVITTILMSIVFLGKLFDPFLTFVLQFMFVYGVLYFVYRMLTTILKTLTNADEEFDNRQALYSPLDLSELKLYIIIYFVVSILVMILTFFVPRIEIDPQYTDIGSFLYAYISAMNILNVIKVGFLIYLISAFNETFSLRNRILQTKSTIPHQHYDGYEE